MLNLADDGFGDDVTAYVILAKAGIWFGLVGDHPIESGDDNVGSIVMILKNAEIE